MAEINVASTPRRSSPRWGQAWRDLLAWASLAWAVLVLCWPLGLTNRILAGVDAFTYFAPYWAYRIAELGVGHLPLWNPYLFLGAPFLANPQAAVLYPPHWLLNGSVPSQALVWSALLHVWLAAGLMFSFARRSLGLSRAAAWLAGVLFALGGFTLGKIENINQLNSLAWLPGLLWCFDEVRRSAGRRGRLRWGVALSGVIALQLLAGHTQTAFVNLVGLGIYAIFSPWLRPPARPFSRPYLLAWLARLLPLVAVLPALGLAAAQLLPTLELSGLGLRTGGLTYRLAVSFSLRPRLLMQTLLPPLAGGLAEAFGSEGFAEFTGYVGVVGLILAGVGLAGLLRRPSPDRPSPLAGLNRDALCGLAILAGAGVFLALGAYNPLYYLLWRFVPGFDLFRAPARWLALYAIAVAGLAGAGLDVWRLDWRSRAASSTSRGLQSVEPPQSILRGVQSADLPQSILSGVRRRVPDVVEGCARRATKFLVFSTSRGSRRTASDRLGSAGLVQRVSWLTRPWMFLALLALLALVAFLVFQQLPGVRTLLGWGGMASLAVALFCAGRRWPQPALAGLIVLALAELWLAGRALPFALATAPAAVTLRNAPAALLAATTGQPPAGRGRFLSMSDIRYDPGDLTELRALQADRLPAEAVERFVRAAKWTEVIAPNLSISLRLPAMDGYDGGVLPTADYGRLQSLFLPEDARLPDGRLREQLRAIPPDRLLDLTGVRFVITDKQQDLWASDVYYDLEQAVTLRPAEPLTLDLASYPPFSATALGVVAVPDAASAPEGGVQVVIGVTGADGRMISLSLAARSPGAGETPQPAMLALPAPMTPTRITVAVSQGAPTALVLRGLSLFDGRTAAHQSITLSPRGDLRRIHSGDVKVYERTAALGRAWLVHGVRPVADQGEALSLLAEGGFDPRTTVLLSGDFPALAPGAALPGESVRVVVHEAERVILHADVRSPAQLVLADAFFPGWAATVDGAAAPIVRANLMFRAVALQPGVHEIVFSYDPGAWRWGGAISLAALAVLALALLASFVPYGGLWH